MRTPPQDLTEQLASGMDALRVDQALAGREGPVDPDLEGAAAGDALAPFLVRLRRTPRLKPAAERRLARRAAAARRLEARLLRGVRRPGGARSTPDTDRVLAWVLRLSRIVATLRRRGASARADRLAAAAGLDAERLLRLATALERIEAARSEALGALAAGHLRLVVFLARRYAGRGVDLADLIQEGSAALLHAAGRYDHRQGTRFGTYAWPFVRQAMARAVHAHRSVVALPVRLAETLPRLLRLRRRLAALLGREPSPAEIARLARLRQDRVEHLLAGLRRPVPLDEPAGAEEAPGSQVDRLRAPDGPTPFDVLAAREEAARLERALAAIPPREALVVRLRYGLGDEDPLTLEEIGRRLAVTRERARQLESRALDRLRRSLGAPAPAPRPARAPRAGGRA